MEELLEEIRDQANAVSGVPPSLSQTPTNSIDDVSISLRFHQGIQRLKRGMERLMKTPPPPSPLEPYLPESSATHPEGCSGSSSSVSTAKRDTPVFSRKEKLAVEAVPPSTTSAPLPNTKCNHEGLRTLLDEVCLVPKRRVVAEYELESERLEADHLHGGETSFQRHSRRDLFEGRLLVHRRHLSHVLRAFPLSRHLPRLRPTPLTAVFLVERTRVSSNTCTSSLLSLPRERERI